MKTILLLSAICLLSCALSGPIPDPGMHRGYCSNCADMREKLGRAYVLQESLVLEKHALEDTIRIRDNKIYELQWLLRGNR